MRKVVQGFASKQRKLVACLECLRTLSNRTLFIAILAACASFSQPTSSNNLTRLEDKVRAQKIVHYNSLGYKLFSPSLKETGIPRDTYVAIDHIGIPKSQSVVIQPGTKILFESGIKIYVDGDLIAKGTSSNRIVLSNVPYEQSFIPINRPDSLWGGIEVASTGSIDFENIEISNSRSGITAASKPDSLKFACVDLKKILSDQFTLNGTGIVNRDTTCFEYQYPLVASTSQAIKKPNKKLSVVLGLTTAASVCGIVTSAVLKNSWQTKYESAKTRNSVESYKSKANAAYTATGIFAGAGSVSACAFGISFAINARRAK